MPEVNPASVLGGVVRNDVVFDQGRRIEGINPTPGCGAAVADRETVNSIQQVTGLKGRDHCPSALTVQYGRIGPPVPFRLVRLGPVESTVEKHVLRKRDSFLVDAGLHPHFAARGDRLVNSCLNGLLSERPTGSVIGIIAVRRHPHDRSRHRPHSSVRLVGTNVHVVALNPRLPIHVQPRAQQHAVVTRIHAGRIRLDVCIAVTHTGQPRVCRDVSFARRYADVVVGRVPIEVVVP